MRCAIIPPEKLELFDKPLSKSLPWIEVGPAMIYSGPFAGSYAINEAILDSCDEWRVRAAKVRADWAAQGVTVEEIDPADLVNPNTPKAP